VAGIQSATVACSQPGDVVGCGAGGAVLGLVAGVVVQAGDVEGVARASVAWREFEVDAGFEGPDRVDDVGVRGDPARPT